jgi:hypothetical protein
MKTTEIEAMGTGRETEPEIET